MYFKYGDVSFRHAPKVGSRSIIGWFSVLREPSLYKEHPEYFVPVNIEDHVYLPLRNRQEVTETLQTPISFVVTRDPIKRFISAYKNRVYTHQEFGNNPPDFDEFVGKFNQFYTENDSIRVHFNSLTSYYGPDKTVYTKIFRTEKLLELRDFLQDHFDKDLPSIRLQQNKPGIEISPTEKQKQFIKNFYKEDYKNGWT